MGMAHDEPVASYDANPAGKREEGWNFHVRQPFSCLLHPLNVYGLMTDENLV
jgi:hypothetical protein